MPVCQSGPCRPIKLRSGPESDHFFVGTDVGPDQTGPDRTVATLVKTSSATVSVPVKLTSVKSSSSTASVPVGPVSVARVAPSCPSDYTGDEWELDNNCYSSPLPAPSLPTLLESEDDANAINIDSEVEDVKPGAGESAEAELSMSYHITFELVLTFSSQARLSKKWVLPI